MENIPNEQDGPGDQDKVREQTTSGQAEPPPLTQPERRILDALREAICAGAQDAKTAAEKTIPKVKSTAADAAYWTAYGASYAAVFQWTFAKGFLPESLKSGCRDGVKAAKAAAEAWTEGRRHRRADAAAVPADHEDPSTSTAQPGTA